MLKPYKSLFSENYSESEKLAHDINELQKRIKEVKKILEDNPDKEALDINMPNGKTAEEEMRILRDAMRLREVEDKGKK